MSRSPSSFARWVREVHGVQGDGRLDVSGLVTSCGGRVDEIDLVGCAGLLLPSSSVFGILLREGDSPRRKRFTVAHELGHFCLPLHRKTAIRCIAPELARDGSTAAVEREANEFAAELLMPSRFVRLMVASGAIDLELASLVADHFDVSTMSAALRVCEITRERAAVLYFREGQLRWGMRLGMPYGLPPSGSRPKGDTVTHDVLCGMAGSSKGEEVDAGSWLPLARPDPSWGALLESSVALDGPGEVLTLLWLTMT